MIRNNNFVIKYINEKPILMSIGQAVCDHKPELLLGDTEIFCWNILSENLSMDELLKRCCEHFKWSVDKKERYSKELRDYIELLLSKGYLLEGGYPHFITSPTTPQLTYEPAVEMTQKNCEQKAVDASVDGTCSIFVQIATLFVEYKGPKYCFPNQFHKFVVEKPINKASSTQLLEVRIMDNLPNFHPTQLSSPEMTRLLLDSKELFVVEKKLSTGKSEYILGFPSFDYVRQINIFDSELRCTMYLAAHAASQDIVDNLRNEIFSAMRHSFLYFAQQNNFYAIHSASIKYMDQAILFSGKSGTGKSTHAGLWVDMYGTEILNGDLNLIGFENKSDPFVYGIPWCGTSGICTEGKTKLGGIVFLEQSQYDHIKELDTTQRILFTSHRFISPTWTEDMLDCNLNCAKALSDKIMICKLCCTPYNSAAFIMKSKIDSVFTGKSTIVSPS